ncbi:hypothetical protein JBP901_gp147 [Bacillus phage JBP901]|uniref:Uncharacterized protein n=1 Tax=Bacillus phage JBP901 TaxID=1498212 RepID=A0A0E3DEY1_9CAUD|nr:hypothetical protein JBP901_gp147 [Bacillus phage JBP901]AID17859.1 hypothetical protein JBP901_gp147 [Bacillus phage JBP901]
MKMPWECEDCGHKELASPFDTFMLCPNCDSQNFFHGSIIEDDLEEYNVYDEEDELDNVVVFEDQYGEKLTIVQEIDDDGDINLLPSDRNLFFSKEDAIELAKAILRVCGEEE